MSRLLPLLASLCAVLPAAQPRLAAAPAESVAPATWGADELVDAVARELSAHFKLEGDLQLELLRPCPLGETKARAWSVLVTGYPSAMASSLLVRCRIIADGASVAEPTLVLRAQLWRDAWVARQPLTTGSAFDPSVLEARRTDLLRERDAVPVAAVDRAFVLARSVQAGRPLTWRDLARRPLVRKGEVVEVAASDGQLVVVLKALALQSGALGDLVAVRNLDSRKEFTAFVTPENRVQVRF